jgi:16S rRNA (adenine1518-N6/adenine1519-N6)-dimethyltransferase
MSKLPKANKELGQHFLRDQKVISTISSDFANECDVIVEVGPGPAVLTQHLAKHNKEFYVLEKDERFYDLLCEYIKPENIFMGDALEFDWADFISKNKLENKKIWLVSNLPYNVGTVLFTQFLSVDSIKFMTLMFQKEVGDKTYLRHEKNQMNGLLALSLNYFNSKQLIKVPPGCFSPPPKVDSVVVTYTRKEQPDVATNNFNDLNTFTRNLFSFKRKQISSVLKKAYPKDLVNESLEETKIEPNRRAETLKFEEVLNLFKSMTNSNK